MRLLLDAPLAGHRSRASAGRHRCHDRARDWRGGNYRSAPDDQLLAAATTDERVLVTYDLRTIPTLLNEWAETGQQHAGVILVDDKTLRPDDIGRLIRALRALVAQSGSQSWRDRVVFLQAR
jgi:hypothetical protein